MAHNAVERYIKFLRDSGAMHVKRGYMMREITPALQSSHLIEETCELQQEILDPGSNESSIMTEACHVYAVFAHLLLINNIDMDRVEALTIDMLKKNWTTDPAKVTAVVPGFGRKGRADPDGGSGSPVDGYSDICLCGHSIRDHRVNGSVITCAMTTCTCLAQIQKEA